MKLRQTTVDPQSVIGGLDGGRDALDERTKGVGQMGKCALEWLARRRVLQKGKEDRGDEVVLVGGRKRGKRFGAVEEASDGGNVDGEGGVLEKGVQCVPGCPAGMGYDTMDGGCAGLEQRVA